MSEELGQARRSYPKGPLLGREIVIMDRDAKDTPLKRYLVVPDSFVEKSVKIVKSNQMCQNNQI